MKSFTFAEFQKTKTAKVFLLALLLCFTAIDSFATAWTTSAAGPVNTLSNWTNGTSSPTTFLTPGDTWTVNMNMTLPSGAIWTLGAASSAPDTLTIATGGTISVGGIPTTPIINVYGVFMMTGGTLTMGGTAASEIVNVYGNTFISSGTINTPASSAHLFLNTNGNFTMSGGTAGTNGSGASLTLNTVGNFFMTGGTINTPAAGAHDTVRVHGNFSMTGGTFSCNGAGCNFNTYVYGNFTMSGPSAMSAIPGNTNTAHLCLPRASGIMMIDNTSTGAWSNTNVYIDTNCIAQLDTNFSTTTGGATYGLIVNGTLICPAAYKVNGADEFILNGVATLEVAHATGINGAIITTGTKTFNDSANYVFNGTVAQVTGTYLPAALFAPDTITISNSAGVTLTQTTSTTGKLIFTSGILNTTPAFTMSVPGAATSVAGAGATSYVNGTLIKTITGLTAVNYEVGDVNYAPMSLALSAAGTAGSLGLKTTNGLHPSVGTSGLSSANMANHYWTITNIGAAGPATVIPTATYNAIDIIGGSNAAFKTQEYTGATWLGTALATTNTLTPYTSTPTTGIALGTLAGDYIFGNVFCGTLPITGTTTVCAGATTTLSDATTGGTWVSSATGIATVSGTGVVTGVAGGTVTISYTNAGCTVTAIVTVNTLPNAGAITGTGIDTVVCVGRTITLADTASGGVWSSTNVTLATVGSTGIVTGVAAGIDTIKYTVTNSCGSTVVKLHVRVLSTAACHAYVNAVANATGTELKIFPNPNTGTFTLKINAGDEHEVHIMITDVVGKMLKEFTTTTNKTIDIKLDNVPGIYILSATDVYGRYFAKFIIE